MTLIVALVCVITPMVGHPTRIKLKGAISCYLDSLYGAKLDLTFNKKKTSFKKTSLKSKTFPMKGITKEANNQEGITKGKG
jgi:hypothetical protein